MFDFLKKKTEVNTTQIVDEIEGITNALVGLTDMEGVKAKS